FLLCNFGGAAVWATTIVSAAFFLGKVVSLEQIVGWIAQIGIVSLLVIVVIVLAPIVWEYGRKKFLAKD
ncbi:MAG: DedA family protein, partial [Cyanobacteria bacterium J06631_2]